MPRIPYHHTPRQPRDLLPPPPEALRRRVAALANERGLRLRWSDKARNVSRRYFVTHQGSNEALYSAARLEDMAAWLEHVFA